MPKDILIYSYTDAEAVKDGVLVDVHSMAKRPINRVTRALWEEFTGPAGELPKALGGSAITDATRLLRLAELVAQKISAGEIVDDMVVIEDYEGKKIWAMPNEVSGWTMMFPEDY